MAKKVEAKIRKFRMKEGAGPHFEPNHEFDPDSPEGEDNPKEIKHVAGDIVTSKRNLKEIFPGKFERPSQDEVEEAEAAEKEAEKAEIKAEKEADKVASEHNALDDFDEEEVEDEHGKKHKKKK